MTIFRREKKINRTLYCKPTINFNKVFNFPKEIWLKLKGLLQSAAQAISLDSA